MSQEILDELVEEFGTGILSSSHPYDGLTIRQCQKLFNKYGLEKATVIVKRWKRIFKESKGLTA
jgi:hypothetical protein